MMWPCRSGVSILSCRVVRRFFFNNPKIMTNHIKQHLQSRRHAGLLLAEKVKQAKIVRSSSVVVGIPEGGIPVARQIAKSFGSPLEIVFSKRIKHPAHSDQSIGTVTLTDVVLHESTQFIPQSYVLNQINLMQRRLNAQFKEYYGDKTKKCLSGKTVILVDDVLQDVDELASCLTILEKENPERIIVAAAVSNIRVIRFL